MLKNHLFTEKMYTLVVQNLNLKTTTMKKVYQLMAAVSLSLLTIGAIAQAPINMNLLKRTPLKGQRPSKALAKEMKVLHQVDRHQAMSGGGLDVGYFNTDYGFVGAGAFTTWAMTGGSGCINNAYVAGDSGSGTDKNYTDYRAATVAFDVIEDVNGTIYTPSAGVEVTVDTIYLTLGYHNTSGTNVDLIVHVGLVGANGYPTGAYYTTDTITVLPHQTALPGNTLDSLYTISVIPNGGLGTIIPKTAPKGYEFCVTVEVSGSKLDSLGVFYGSPYYTCTSYGYAQRTLCGLPFGPAANVNSFMSGWEFYNTAAYGGDGHTVLTWPNSDAMLYNTAHVFGDYWAATPTCSPNDTGYLYFQDNYIEVGIDTNMPAAVNNVAGNADFSVGQNYPNPFSQQTNISYNLNKESNVVFTVTDMAGRMIVDNNYSTVGAGQHIITLAANQFSPGVYFYSFNVNGNVVTKKMVITQ
jgi:hypothetical protein